MDEIIHKLMQIGLTAYEAKAYLALLRKSPVIGYEVSKIAKIPTAKIYETLTNLKNKGIILSSTSEPVLYSPVSPDVLLNRFQKEFDTSIKNLSVSLSNVASIPDVDITWNLSGYSAVTEKMIAVINHATADLLVSIWPQEAEIIKGQLIGAEQKGIRVTAGVFGNCELGCTRTVNLNSCGASSQKRLGKRLNVVVGDSKEVVIGEIGSGQDAAGVWTTTPCIVLTAKEYIKHDFWGKALVDAVGKERFDAMCRDNDILSYLIQNR